MDVNPIELIHGFTLIFIVFLTAGVMILMIAGYVQPIMTNISQEQNITNFDLPTKYQQGVDRFYIAVAILCAIPFLFIAAKMLYSREHFVN